MKILLYATLVCAQLSVTICIPRVICYYPDYRLKTLAPIDFDPLLCTHIHFSFHKYDDAHNVIVDSTGSARPALYNRLKTLKKRNSKLKLMVAVAGYGMPDQPFSHMVNDPKLRAPFIKHTVAYLKKYGFDGLDLDWEYPVCWGGDCTKGPATDKLNFGKLLLELRQAFIKQKPRLLLSAAVSVAIVGRYDVAYDIPAMAKALDYMCVMTYDMHGVWDKKLGHHGAFGLFLNWTMPYVAKGFPKQKIMMGVPFYGRGFTMTDPAKHYAGNAITGVGNTPAGDNGESMYSELCDLVKTKGWAKLRNSHYGSDPYAYHDNIWVGYDDPFQAYDKAKWAKDHGFGGIMVWEIGQDDQKKCCSVKFPLLRAINNALFNTGKGPSAYNCEHK